MKTIVVNGTEYKFRCVVTLPKKINESVGVLLQLEIFKDGKAMTKKECSGYLVEKIEEFIRELI